MNPIQRAVRVYVGPMNEGGSGNVMTSKLTGIT